MASVLDDLMEKASRLQTSVKMGELDSLHDTDDLEGYDSKGVRQQIVHTRQDVVMIVSLLSNVAELMQETVLMMRVFFWAFIAYLIYLAYSSFIA